MLQNSAHAGREEHLRSRSAGFQLHFAQPIDHAVLPTAIDSVTTRRLGGSLGRDAE